MAADKMNYAEASAIAQAMKHQIRTGAFWEDMSGAAKESLDQIATGIARMVSGDGMHWDAIVDYAHAGKPTTDAVPPPAPKPQPTSGQLERDILGLVRGIPNRGDYA